MRAGHLPGFGLPAMMRKMDDKAVIFLHIPKTAGTTLNRIIEWQYNPLAIFTMDPYRIRVTQQKEPQQAPAAPPKPAHGARTFVLWHP